VTRLIDLGIERFLLASSLRGVLAQRLVRCLCPECRKPLAVTEQERELFGPECPDQLWSPVGCSACSDTGYSGRTGIYELLTADDHLTELIHDGAAEAVLRSHGERLGCRSLRADGMRLLRNGTTSLEELLRVTED
jgi:general secretion pathway protein E